ncbi:hypothetical protein CSKR_104586 [Clonorchis sinensis]|uniref:Uncharacterized protein n=1 Tax=Clonorchis sinensis TaxID=79923 RepID=A0A419PED2_CLOSI|nr:hypothetical protein CSKR_104586 [Clonorchis sinensis]
MGILHGISSEFTPVVLDFWPASRQNQSSAHECHYLPRLSFVVTVRRNCTHIPLYPSQSGAATAKILSHARLTRNSGRLPVRDQAQIYLVENLDPAANHDSALAECRLPMVHPERIRISRKFATYAIYMGRCTNALESFGASIYPLVRLRSRTKLIKYRYYSTETQQRWQLARAVSGGCDDILSPSDLWNDFGQRKCKCPLNPMR